MRDMNDMDIKKAFSELEPDKETADKIYNNILSSSFTPAFESVKKKKIRLTRKNLTVIACAGIIIAGTIVSTCSALVLNVNKKATPETTETAVTETESIYTDSDNNEKIYEESSEDSTEEKEVISETVSSEKVTESSETTEKITVNGREYIIVSTEATTKSDGRLHAGNGNTILKDSTKVTEKTEKKTNVKTTAKTAEEKQSTTKKVTSVENVEKVKTTTIKTTKTIKETTYAEVKSENQIQTTVKPSQSGNVVTDAAATEEIALTTKKETVGVVTTTVAADATENTETIEETSSDSDKSSYYSPWEYIEVTYNGQEYYFDGSQLSDEVIQHYLGLYKIYNSDFSQYITEDAYYIDDDTIAVEIGSVFYIYRHS